MSRADGRNESGKLARRQKRRKRKDMKVRLIVQLIASGLLLGGASGILWASDCTLTTEEMAGVHGGTPDNSCCLKGNPCYEPPCNEHNECVNCDRAGSYHWSDVASTGDNCVVISRPTGCGYQKLQPTCTMEPNPPYAFKCRGGSAGDHDYPCPTLDLDVMQSTVCP